MPRVILAPLEFRPMKVTLVLATVTTNLPDGSTFGFYRFSVTGQADIDSAETTQVLDLAPGSYTAGVVAFDANGSPLPGSASASFTVPAPAATFEAPASLTVTLG